MASWLSEGEKAAHYRLSSLDRPGEQLVAHVLKSNGENYSSWKLAMTNALIAKQKIAYITGELPKPPPGHPNDQDWTRCNSMVICWILNSFDEFLFLDVKYHSTARALWKGLQHLFERKLQPANTFKSFKENIALPEERLRDMSMSAIREYYSAIDDNEVALCVKDLNSPSFHPSMVSLWVTDSFERKDTERDLLSKLLVKLVKSQDGTLTQAQLIQGFESVLGTLEDAVNDAPRASEFLGRLFAKVITESVISLKEIGRLIHDGGEEPGRLLEVGLAADVLGSTLEVIKDEKGDEVLKEICSRSNLRLESFRPPGITSRKLEKFI